jgi:hypothetical protein
MIFYFLINVDLLSNIFAILVVKLFLNIILTVLFVL